MSHREAVALLWPDQQRPKRGPKPRISLELIIDTGIGLADADGLESVSMQRIADQLGVTKMSLYRYAPGKAELLALMLDRAVGPPPEGLGRSRDWRTGLRDWALAMFDALLLHPWSITLAVGARPFGPNELDWTEIGLHALADTPLDAAARLDTLALLAGHVRGIVQQSTGGTDDDPEQGIGEAMAEVFASHADRYPETVAAFASAQASDRTGDALAFGIDRILDGLDHVIAEA